MNNRNLILALAGLTAVWIAPRAALADASCASVTGDVVLSARTPQVDLYDAANGKVVKSVDQDKFPACTPVTARAPNMMLQVNVVGGSFWVPPHMVNTRLGGKQAAICRNLAMGTEDSKVGSTRGLGEGCPKPGAQGK